MLVVATPDELLQTFNDLTETPTLRLAKAVIEGRARYNAILYVSFCEPVGQQPDGQLAVRCISGAALNMFDVVLNQLAEMVARCRHGEYKHGDMTVRVVSCPRHRAVFHATTDGALYHAVFVRWLELPQNELVNMHT